MADRLIVDLGADGRVTVSAQREGELPDFAGEPFDLAWPLGEEDLEELRWYLEDYLRAPYGADADRVERIAKALDGWGRRVFESVLGSGPARDAYVGARPRGAPAARRRWRSIWSG